MTITLAYLEDRARAEALDEFTYDPTVDRTVAQERLRDAAMHGVVDNATLTRLLGENLWLGLDREAANLASEGGNLFHGISVALDNHLRAIAYAEFDRLVAASRVASAPAAPAPRAVFAFPG
ncbi:hypothetical protein [Ramlibacter alkalitolerans]|uniref:Uncharacterized protein n=1 Tax=Ramlibacter alkalitolerans TaxID=2039631 RepID=A0ABS1JTZ8_9BURK|nr:hypothetical protein [Ramlibacter alkalitolerans]MBL0427709.1 hypothetical protein [Ramlibacter alkalitolerans]